MLKRRLKEPFGKAGLTVAILALVLAMVGGAYAAGGLTKSQEKQVTKIAKKYAGKPGATGPAGANGTNGTNGKDGAAGKEGPEGKQGPEGKPGKDGTTGFTKTLPKGESLKGEWSLTGESAAGGPEGTPALSSVSFGIPLAAAPAVHYIREDGLEAIVSGGKEEQVTSTECLGEVEDPQANPGALCIYAKEEQNTEKALGTFLFPNACALAETGLCTISAPAADPYGFGLMTLAEHAGNIRVAGTWAVTAE